jgi:primosomal replication protein N
VHNQFWLEAELLQREAMRYTPAGLACITCQLRHTSEQEEAGSTRCIHAEFNAIAFGETAKKIAGYHLGKRIKLVGFFAAKNQYSQQLILHIQKIKVID